MTQHEFLKVLDELFQKERDIGDTKGVEYADKSDRLANFKRIAHSLGVDPKVVLWVYATKHFDSISHYIREGKTLSESIDGRILDLRVYLSLLLALINEQKEA